MTDEKSAEKVLLDFPDGNGTTVQFVETPAGVALRINVGGYVITKPAREWHRAIIAASVGAQPVAYLSQQVIDSGVWKHPAGKYMVPVYTTPPQSTACSCSFDAWQENPYTKTLQASIANDYTPKNPTADTVPEGYFMAVAGTVQVPRTKDEAELMVRLGSMFLATNKEPHHDQDTR